jgi:hypothetical protein
MSDDARRAEAPREAPDVAWRPVLLAVLGFLAFAAAALVAIRAYYAWDVRGPVVTPPRAFPEPRLQAAPFADQNRLQSEQRQRLTGYAWVDRSQDVARIPIERAMDLIAARGADAYAPLTPPAEPSPIRTPEQRP